MHFEHLEGTVALKSPYLDFGQLRHQNLTPLYCLQSSRWVERNKVEVAGSMCTFSGSTSISVGSTGVSADTDRAVSADSTGIWVGSTETWGSKVSAGSMVWVGSMALVGSMEGLAGSTGCFLMGHSSSL